MTRRGFLGGLFGCSCLAAQTILMLRSPARYNYYIDANGDDGNDGSSPQKAFATLSAAQAAALAFGDGVRLALARGSAWRESLDLGLLDNVAIGAYGEGALPLITSGEVVTGEWQDSTDRADEHSNVYSTSWDLETTLADGLTVLEDGVRLRDIWTTLADVNSTPGSYLAAPTTGGTVTIYIHPTGSTNPNTNGREYEIPVRASALMVGDNATVSDLITTLNSHNDGSFRAGAGLNANRVLSSFGTKHNHLANGNNARTDMIVAESYQNTTPGSSAWAVDFDGESIVGKTAEFRRCGFVWGRNLIQTASVNGYTTHDAGAGELALASYVGCWGVGANAAFGSASIVETRIENSFMVSRVLWGGNGLAKLTVNRLQYHNDTPITVNTNNVAIGLDVAIENSAFYNVVASNNAPLSCGGSFDLIVRNNVWVSSVNRGFMQDSGISGGSLVVEGNIITCHPGIRYHVVARTMQPFQADHNIYYHPGSDEMLGQFDGSAIDTLAAWQAATGQDLNSVWLTDAQYADFFLGDPAAGDFRVNPNAEVTDAAGNVHIGQFPDGTPITAAGPQTHYDWNTRAVAAGPPTAWPDVPETVAECEAYVAAPGEWEF